MERKLFEDNELIHAVIECNYEKVRELTLKKYNTIIPYFINFVNKSKNS